MNWWEEADLVSDESAGGNWWEESKLASEAPATQPIEALPTSGLGQEQSAGLMGSIKQAGSNFADRAKRKGLELAARGIVSHADTTQYFGDRVKDTGLGIVSGSTMAVQAPVGIATLFDGGYTARALEDLGFRPGEAIDFLADAKSDRSKKLMQDFADEDSWWGKFMHVAENPSIAVDAAVQSTPSMVFGGVASKGLGALGVANKTLAGAAGEGLTSAGLQAENIRGQTDDGNLTLAQRGYSAATGLLVTLFGFGGGRLADKLGLPDPQTVLAGGKATTIAVIRDNSITEQSKRTVVNAIREGVFEELGQETAETVLENIALGRPWSEGLSDAQVLGIAAGGITGGVTANIRGAYASTEADSVNAVDESDNLPPAGNDSNLPIDDGAIPQQAMDSPSIDEQLMAAVDRFHGDRNDSAAIYDIGDTPSAIEIDNTGLPFSNELAQGQDASIPQQTDRPLDAPVEAQQSAADGSLQQSGGQQPIDADITPQSDTASALQTPKQMRNIDIARNKWDSMTKDERIDTAINELGFDQSEAEFLAGRNFEYLGITEARSLITNKNWLEGRSDADLAQPKQTQPEQTQTQPEAEESFKQDAVEGDTQPEAVDSSVEVDLFGDPIEQNAVEGLPVQEVPLGNLTLSEEVPQFKEGADDSGVVEPLGGKFDRRGVAPIQAWERLDGSLEIISGRHRFDLAKRSGEQTIPAQIHREADGFDAVAAATLDAELNIRDEQGGIADYANYFRNSQITEEEADARGLLARQKGKAGFIIGNLASDDTFASHSASIITDEAARRIAEAAPNNDGLQAVGLKSLQEGSSIADAVNTIHAVSTFAPQGNVEQGDIFGMDTSGIEQAKKMARIATSKQRDIQANISAAKNAAKSPARAKKMGIDVKNPESVLSKIRELEAEKQAWDNWSTNPDLVAQIRAEMQPEEALPTPKKQGVEKPVAETEAQAKALDTPPKPQAPTEAAPSNDGAFFGQEESAERKESNAESGFELTTQTEQELAAQEAERKAAEKAEAKAQAEIDKKAAQEAEKKAVKANNEAANAEFALGQDAEENIGGQRNILDAINNAAQEADKNPTEAQKEAGNYKKGHVSIQGLDVSIENPKGSTRSGIDANGKPWSVKMKSHYGYIKKTEGADGDHVDVFIGDRPESEKVYVVDQKHQKTGAFDEHKVMIGFDRLPKAIEAYKANYSKDWKVGKVTSLSMDEFKTWLKEGDTTKTIASWKQLDKPAAKKPDNQKPTKIDDFGEKLEGARKDLPRNFSDNLSDSDVKSQPLSKLWPSDLHTKIDNPVTAAIMFVLRQNIPNKPRVSYKLNQWVQTVQSARIAAHELIDTHTLEQLEAKAKEKGFIGLSEKIFTPAKLLSQLPKESWGRVSDINERPHSYRFGEDGERIPMPSSSIRIDGTLHRFEVGEFGAKEINEIKRLLNAQPETGLTTRDFDIYTRRADGTTYIARKVDKEKRSLKEFTKAEGVKAAREYLNSNVAELEAAWEAVKERDNVGKSDVRNKSNRERLGKDWRKGKDITPEQFGDTFGFRGVQFGNWVSQGKGGKERQGMLNQAYDALMDLSSILNVPPKALSLNGTLGLAFGARGKGRAMAHYERDTVVINLTKTKGAGSLAHEWFHALDNYFAGLRGVNQSAKESFVTYQPEAYYVHNKRSNAKIAKKDFEKAMRGEKFNGGYVLTGERNPSDWTLVDGIRPEVETAFANLVEALNKAPMHERAKVLDQGSSKKYWSSIIERAARSFEDYTIMKLDEEGITNDYLANVVSFKEFKRAKERYPYNKPEEMQPIKEAFDVLFNTIESREDADGNVALYSRNDGRNKQGMDKEAVENIANRLLEGKDNRVHIVQSYGDLPKDVRAAIEQDGTSEGDFDAVHYKGKSYIIADAMTSQAEVEAAIFHEHFTHGGLRTLYGKDLANKLDDMLFKAGGIAGVRMQAKKQGIDLSAYERALADNPNISAENKKRILMEELMAHMAHTTGTLRRRLEEVIGAIRQWLRDNGFAELAKLSASDIAYVLKQAREAAIEAVNGQQAQAQVMFSVQARRGRYNKNQLDLFEELNDLEGVDPYESTTQRQNTTEKQRQLGRSAISDLFRWLRNSSRTRSDNAKSTEGGVSLIGASIYKNFKAGKPYQLLGKTVNSTADLAALAQVYRDPRFETFRAFYLDKNNKIILEEAASTRMPASVAFAEGTLEGIKEKQEKVGASKVYILHNHPSGNPEPSRDDVVLTNHLNNVLGFAFAGHVVIDHNKYAFINKQGDYTIHDAEELAGIDFSSKPEVPHDLLEKEIHSPSDIAVIGKNIAHSNDPVIVVTKGGLALKTGLIASLPMELLERLRSKNVSKKTQAIAVVRRMIRAGGVGGKLFVVLPKNANLSVNYQWMHDFAQDVVDSNGDSVIRVLSGNVSIDDFAGVSIRGNKLSRQRTTLREGTQNYNEEPQTETEAFKKWFGDSKVVDANGEPLVVYHGTRRDFSEFDMQQPRGAIGNPKGAYFTADRSVAEQYAENDDGELDSKSNIIAAYLRIESDADGKIIDSAYRGREYVVFDPASIKSATDNNGDFDSTNPDIRYSQTQQGQPRASLSASSVSETLNSALGERLASSVNVVQSERDLPKGLVPIESNDIIEGAFDPSTNKIYLVADNLPTPERAVWVAFHELFHRGIRGTRVFTDYQATLSRAGNNKMVERVADAIMREHNLRNKAEAVEEALAELNAAEETGDYSQIESRYGVKVLNGLKHGIRLHIESFVNAVRRVLYGISGKVYVSDAEVWRVIQGAREGYAEFNENGERINYGLFSRQQQGNLSGLGERPDETKFRALQRKLQDSFNRFEVIQDWLEESGVNLQETSRVYEAETRMQGRIASQLEDFREKVFEPLIAKVAEAGKTMEQLEELLHAQHAQERNAHIASINSAFPDGGSGMLNADAKAILAQYASDTELQSLADEFREISKRRLELLVKEGIYSQQDADNMQKSYTYYVPLKGGPDNEYYTGTGQGLTGKKDIKRALGHTEREGGESIVENIAVDFERAVMLAEKNRMAKQLLSLALDTNDPNLISLGKPEKRAVLVNKTSYGVWHGGHLVGSFLSKREAQHFVAVNQGLIGNGAVIQKTSDPSVVYSASPQLASNETVVFINGEQIRIQINDDLLARAWNNLGQNSVVGILKMSAGLNRWLSTVYTGYSPDFFVRNIIRDFSTGFSNVTGEEGFTTAVRAVMNYPSALDQLRRYYFSGYASPMIQSYRAAGGKTGGAWISDLEKIGDDVSRNFNDAIKLMDVYKRSGKRAVTASALRRVFKPLFKYVEKMNAVSENAYRVAIYQTMVQQGRTVEDAAYRAKNVTVNFNKRGEWGAGLNAYTLFYNAAIQGAANYGHAMVAGKHKEQLWALTAGLASLAFMMAQAGYGGDDDDQDKLKDFELERSIPIRTSNGWITIPIPYEMGFFWSFGRHMSDLVDGKKSVQQTALSMAYSFASAYTTYGDVLKDGELDSKNFYTFLPTALQIPAGPIVNRSTFGSPIYPESTFDPQQPDSQKMYRNTKGSIFELMTTTLNNLSGGDSVTEGAISVSPETLKYLNSALTGGAGRFIYDAMNIPAMLMQGVELGDLDSRDIPIARVVYKTETIAEQRNKFRAKAKKQQEALENFNRAKSVVKDQMRHIGESEEGLIEKYGFSQSQLLEQARLAEAIRKLAGDKRKAQAVVLGDKSRPLAARRADARKIESEEQELYEVFFNNLK